MYLLINDYFTEQRYVSCPSPIRSLTGSDPHKIRPTSTPGETPPLHTLVCTSFSSVVGVLLHLGLKIPTLVVHVFGTSPVLEPSKPQIFRSHRPRVTGPFSRHPLHVFSHLRPTLKFSGPFKNPSPRHIRFSTKTFS